MNQADTPHTRNAQTRPRATSNTMKVLVLMGVCLPGGRNVEGKGVRSTFENSSVAPVRLRENLKQLGQFLTETPGFVTLFTWTCAVRSSGALILWALVVASLLVGPCEHA